MSRAKDVRHPGLRLGEGHPDVAADAEEMNFGFWVFLMSDAIVFALLFATYARMVSSVAGGLGPEALFDLKSITIETAALLASSFTFGMASLALKYARSPRPLVKWLCVTLLLAAVFLGFELHDFAHMIAMGAGPSRSGFASAFFALVPLHGLHVLAGCVWAIALMAQIAIHGIDKEVKLGVQRLGLFWHFLDIVWVVIFTVVYLGGLA
ncbi:cytochrome c oxidase subunit 3 [Pararhizobium mangrovi]|uniref:Cytochrome bo(3) ubiquinol oxidase subunit 3 n=1 Tax=Pararhizobium mangrovi TaxID=2590452 RepID=A0A506U6Y3_9HYPH|nr:cytochrome c oxidase subunit 3 [Pararhizobium mangrovi]TPW29610.1 cytochrome o ubiquinol oxidase subunit III [Pararhizobium mangrovi]